VKDHLISDLNVDEQRIHLVNSGIDVAKFQKCDEEQRIQMRSQIGVADEKLIGMIARLSDVKGQDIIISAMPEILKSVKNVKLCLVGTGKLKEKCESLVEELKVADHVIFLPQEAEAHNLLHMFDLVVSPSREEGLGLSIMEAQAAGIAVVATNVGGIPTLITQNKTGLMVVPENSSALAREITRILHDQELSKRISVNAQKKAVEYYCKDTMLDKTIDVYKEVLGEDS